MTLRQALHAAILGAGLACLTGCLAPPPRLLVESGHGIVRADNQAPGRLAAQLLDVLTPQVRARIPDTRVDPVEVWVQRRLAVYRGWPVDSQVPAFTVEGDGRIHVLEGDEIELSAALSHELVHALLGPSWKTLPPVAEEGLADWMQEELNRPVASSLRADHLAKASAAVGGLNFGVWSLSRSQRGRRLASIQFPQSITGSKPLDPRRALDEGDAGSGSIFQPYQVAVSDPRLYGIGYLVVSRIIERRGMGTLHRMCQQAAAEGLRSVPSDWLLEAAGLQSGPSTWRRIITRRVRYGELMAMGRQLVPELVELVVDDIGPRSGASSGREFLDEVRPVFGLVDGETRIDLENLPGFAQTLVARWPGRRRLASGVTTFQKAVSWASTVPAADAPVSSAAVPPQAGSRRPTP